MDAGTEPYLRAGAAVFNAGHYHAAHDAWEERWLALPEGDEKDCLQGLIQLSAAVHHAREHNWEGATGLAASAREYLAGVDCEVNRDAIRAYLAALARDPELVERAPPVRLEVGGEAVGLDDLLFPAAGLAAIALAEVFGHEDLLEQAVAYAEADLDAEEVSSPFVTLVLDYLTGENRGLVVQRLRQHASRRDHRESDVEGLF